MSVSSAYMPLYHLVPGALEIKPGSSGNVGSALNYRALSLALHLLFFFFKFNFLYFYQPQALLVFLDFLWLISLMIFFFIKRFVALRQGQTELLHLPFSSA